MHIMAVVKINRLSPNTMIYNLPNGSLLNSILFCEFSLLAVFACVFSAYLLHNFTGESGVSVILTNRRPRKSWSFTFSFKNFTSFNVGLRATHNLTNSDARNSVFRGQGAHFSMFTRISFSDLFSLPRMKTLWLNKSLFDLLLSVSTVIFGVAKIKMFGIDAKTDVATGTLVQNPHSFWNWPNIENPRSDVGVNLTRECPLVVSNASPKSSMVHGGAAKAVPNPMGWSDENTFPESLRKSFGKSLLGEIIRGNVLLHNVNFRLALCRVLGCFIQRGNIFIIGNSQGIAT